MCQRDRVLGRFLSRWFLADDHELVYELDVVVDGPETGRTPTHPWRGTWVTPLASSRSSHTCFINTHPQHKYSIKQPLPMMRKDVPQWFSAGNLRIRSNSQGIPEEAFEGLGYWLVETQQLLDRQSDFCLCLPRFSSWLCCNSPSGTDRHGAFSSF